MLVSIETVIAYLLLKTISDWLKHVVKTAKLPRIFGINKHYYTQNLCISYVENQSFKTARN